MDYAAHNVPSYQHMMGSPKPAHMGSQSQGHMAGGNAGWHQAGGKGPASKRGMDTDMDRD
jgi:hypothetical protein